MEARAWKLLGVTIGVALAGGDRYILGLGTIEPRKNLVGLIIGASVVFMFSSLAINAVTRAAGAIARKWLQEQHALAIREKHDGALADRAYTNSCTAGSGDADVGRLALEVLLVAGNAGKAGVVPLEVVMLRGEQLVNIAVTPRAKRRLPAAETAMCALT